MRGLSNAVLLGSVMVFIAVGLSLFWHSSEAQLLRSIETEYERFSHVFSKDIIVYSVLAFEKAELEKAIRDRMTHLTYSELEEIRESPESIIPSESLVEYVVNYMDKALGTRTSVQVFYTYTSVSVDLWPTLEINQKAEVEVVKDGDVVKVFLPEERVYVFPLDVRNLLRLNVRTSVPWNTCKDGFLETVEKELITAYPENLNIEVNCYHVETVPIEDCEVPVYARCKVLLSIDYPPDRLPVTIDVTVSAS